MSSDTSFADRKLCGFLCTVLTLTPRDDSDTTDIPFPEPCEIFGEGGEVGFRTPNGVVLGPVLDSLQCGGGGGGGSNKIKRRNKIGMVNGSVSVVHQLHAMVTRKCARIDARVVCVEALPRVVVLVDVYVPVQVWSGWQFPRSGPVAGAVFRHLRCKEWCRLPLITPCRHLLCLDCVSIDNTKCTYPGCSKLYEMQSREARPENPKPKWPVPKDLIELQPSYKQDNWDPDWQSTSSSKVSYLVQRLKALRGTNEETYFNTENSNDDLHIENSLHRSDDKSSIQTCSMSSTKTNLNPEKVLIFSQFLEHIHAIEQQLTIAGIKYTGMYSPMHSSNKKKSLAMFQHDSNCMALLMDGSAALGLDLSFVTHVFLMEPIWDRSMEEQVISRAHRMGASRPIYVETLAMRGTIEEQMLDFLQDADNFRRSPIKDATESVDDSGGRGYRSLHDFAESSYLLKLRSVYTNLESPKGV